MHRIINLLAIIVPKPDTISKSLLIKKMAKFLQHGRKGTDENLMEN